jgi:GNAT superfamily N-acetyltransferase
MNIKMKFEEMNLKDKEKILKLWNDNIGTVYPLDSKLFTQNFGSDKQNKKILGAFDGEKLAGFIIYKQWTSQSGILKADKSIGYINSIIVDVNYRNTGVGSDLLDYAEKELIGEGVKLIHAGRDTNHFFPGIPYECVKAQEFFANKGYSLAETFYDLICNISNVNFEKLPNMKINNDKKYKIEILNNEDRENLFEFFRKCFYGRWYQEMMDFFEIGMEDRDIVVFIL